eukprot:scaffold51488_cov17-Tisochrysis_lutea.AAC.1
MLQTLNALINAASSSPPSVCAAENAVAAQRSASTGTATPGVKGNRPKGAVIGAKPQYNSQGLLAAVQQLSVSTGGGAVSSMVSYGGTSMQGHGAAVLLMIVY